MTGDDNWPAVAVNLRKAIKSWARVTRILCREGADPMISGVFKGGRPGGSDFWVRYVGTDPPDGAGSGKLPAKDRATD